MHCPLRRIDHVTDHRALPGRGWRMRASATETPVCEASRFSMSNAQFRENTLGKDCRKADQFATLAIGRNLPNVSLNLACEKREARGDHLQNGDSYKPRRTFQEIDGHGRQGRNAPSSQCGNVDQPVCLHVTNAVSIDPKSDIHCSVLSFYFNGPQSAIMLLMNRCSQQELKIGMREICGLLREDVIRSRRSCSRRLGLFFRRSKLNPLDAR